MSVAVVIPTSPRDEWRQRALDYIVSWYAHELPDAQLIVEETPVDEEWSKGAAVAAGVARTDADVLVLADADSFIREPRLLANAVDLARRGMSWIVPHGLVMRLTDAETGHLLGGAPLRTSGLARPAYHGLAGGGITVLTRAAYETVNGVDPRFMGWGGEDVSFGWALTTLVGPERRLRGHLVHLWHPHPAPNLRGSLASEDLVARYQAARDYPRRMRALVRGVDPEPVDQLATPIKFWGKSGRIKFKLSDGALVHFQRGIHATTCPDTRDALRRHSGAQEMP